MGQQTGSKFRKDYVKAEYCHPAYLTSMQNTLCEKGWMTQDGIKIAKRNINNLRYADDTVLMAENEEELQSLLIRVKEKSEKAGLKLNIQKMKIMASDPITLWQIEGEKVEAVTDFLFLGSQITADYDCSHETERCLLLESKAMSNLNNLLKSRDITLPTSLCPYSQSCGFCSSYVRL